MPRICPISSRRVDEGAVRATALVVTAAAVAACLVPTLYLLALLAADFLVRGFLRPALSPLAAVGRWLAAATGVAKRPINAGPKIFAARLGFLLSLAAVAFHGLGLEAGVRAALGVLAGCAALEGLFGLCLGCHLYTWLIRFAPPPGPSEPRGVAMVRPAPSPGPACGPARP
jgi:hypothetical protein